MKNLYPTWQEASVAAINCKLRFIKVYLKNAKNYDPRLPSNPNIYYENFPGWREFLAIDKYYQTWEEASEVAISLGIVSSKYYIGKAQGLDTKLPSNPNIYYKDFPGWKRFLDPKKKEFLNSSKKEFLNPEKNDKYQTWQEASTAAIALGMDSYTSYDQRLDSRLPSSPSTYYKDFPGWKEFLSIKKEKKYLNWKEASAAAIDIYIYSPKDYKIKYSRDPKLPKRPDYFYKDFPGWREFLGKNLTEKARNYVT
jgi:hypothetical protein